MRLLSVAAVFASLLLASATLGGQNFPYRAYITADDTYVRSGPGQSYYPTDKLKAGQEVEVYRHDPGGWYAIRPPRGSFSWISGRYLEMKDKHLAVVTDEQVAARIGSRFSEIRDVIQVRLHRGEMVEVLEEKPVVGSRGPSWYKISPPSGEFRWVFGKYVDANYSTSGVRQTSAPASTAAVIAPGASQGASAATEQVAATTTGSVAPTGEPTASENAVNAAQPPEAAIPEQPAFAPVGERRITAEEFQKQLAEIDVELAMMVAEEPTVWKFDPMFLRAQSLLAQAETAVERGRARLLVSKISRFEDLKRRYDSVNTMRDQVDLANRQLAAGERPAGSAGQASAGFDGTGTLTRVVSSKVGAPRYALVDRNGAVRYYVSPAPGVDLRHYVGRQIGVSGARGYMPEQRAQHVMAKHVTPLESTQR